MTRISSLRCAALLLLGVSLGFGEASAGHELHITVAAQPDFAGAFEQALALARRSRQAHPTQAVVIDLPHGPQRLSRRVVIVAEDSGEADAPLIIRGAPDGSTELTGSIPIQAEPLKPADPAWPLLPAAARPAIKVVDLSSLQLGRKFDITPRGWLRFGAWAGFELYQGDQKLHLTRWPDKGLASIPDGPQEGTPTTSLMALLARRFPHETSLILAGFPRHGWDFDMVPIGRAVSLGAALEAAHVPWHREGRFFVLNGLSQLADRGHYALDRAAQRVYLIPFDSRPLELSVTGSLLAIDGAKHVRIEHLALNKSLGRTVELAHAVDVQFSDCFIGQSGASALGIGDSSGVVVDRCVVADTAEEGVFLGGGDADRLRAGGNIIRNSWIHSFATESLTYRPGVQLDGIGNVISHSLIEHGPHSGIILRGNDQLVVASEIRDLIRMSDDAGAIYAGKNLTYRGNQIRNNVVSNLGNTIFASHAAVGIYLDDQISDASVEENTIFDVPVPILIGGGSYISVLKNMVCVEAGGAAVQLDDRGRTWQRDLVKSGGPLRRQLGEQARLHPAWIQRYPTIADSLAHADGMPAHDAFFQNRVFGGPLIGFSASDLAKTVQLEGNETSEGIKTGPLCREAARAASERAGALVKALAYAAKGKTIFANTSF